MLQDDVWLTCTPAWAHLTVGADDRPDPALARLISLDVGVEDMSILHHNCSVARVRRAPLEDLMELTALFLCTEKCAPKCV